MSKHILIVDDEPDVVQIIQTILRSKGYDVTGVTDAKFGLDTARRLRPDLILCDLMMPGMSGMEFIKQIRKDEQLQATPIIALSALGATSGKSEDFWKRGLQVDDFMAKPFDPLDLLGRVEYLFRRTNYISENDGEGGQGGGNGSREPAGPSEADLAEASPKMVVRYFVEAWNTQDFATEFRCLSSEMTGGISEREYMGRRRQCYIEEQGENRRQHITNYIEDKTSHNVSKVICEREDVISGRKKLRRETYVMRKDNNGWKIVSMRSVPVAPGAEKVRQE